MHYHIYCDSACEPFHPDGILTWAFLVKVKGKIIHQDTKIIGWGKGMTNNRGEMTAVVAAMYWLIKLPVEEQKPVLLSSDSELIINQCTGRYNCYDERLLQMRDLILRARDRYRSGVLFRHVRRENNKEADALSRSLYTKRMLQLMRDNQLDILFEGDDLSW